MKKALGATGVVVTALAMAACAQKEPAAVPQLGMANPASTYCVKIGGMLRIEKLREVMR